MLLLAATPIGNLGDATARLVDALGRVPIVVAEDTRSAQRLLAGLHVEHRPRLVALHEHNERARAAEVVEWARDADVLVISDAGMPTVSDPGYALVTVAVEAGVDVTVLPGPSAVVTALAVSGLPTDRFAFEGFLPRKPGERRRALRALAVERRTLVFFESPNRVAASLADLAATFGDDRPAAVCRELTKLHEEVVRGPLAELAAWADGGVRGEIVLVVGGAAPVSADLPDAVAEVVSRSASGERLKDVAAEVAQTTGLSTRDLYEGALAARRA